MVEKRDSVWERGVKCKGEEAMDGRGQGEGGISVEGEGWEMRIRRSRKKQGSRGNV